LKEIHNILSNSSLWPNRLYEIGGIDRDSRSYMGPSGTISRAAQI